MDLFFTVETDEEWSKAVSSHYGGYCSWPGCSSTFGIGAHHIVRREEQGLRRLVANGVLLCTEHHEYVESVKGRPIYDKVMRLLVGRKRYEELQRRLAENLEDYGSDEIPEMPSSSLDF